LLYGYIVDFWCPKAWLALEVDGKHHLNQVGYDKKRDAVLKKKGIETMRFTASQVNTNPAAVVALIKGKIKRCIRS